MPDINLANVDLEKAAADLGNAVKEAAYVAVGLGVLGFQKVQVQRVELTKQLEAQLAQLPALTENLNDQAEGYIAFAREQLAEQFDRVEELLPQAARDLVQAARSAALTQERNLRSAVGLA